MDSRFYSINIQGHFTLKSKQKDQEMEKVIAIKLTGKDVEPSKLTYKKLTELVDKYFRILISLSSSMDTTFEYQDAKYSLVEIGKGSINLCFKELGEVTTLYTSSIALADAISSNQISNLPLNTQMELSEFGKALKSNEDPLCVELFNQAGLTVIVQPDTVIIESKKIGSIETIYGELTDVGGTKPNVHILTRNGSIKCEVTKAQAIELGSRLYTHVGLTGRIDRFEGDDKPQRFIVERIEAYDETKWKNNLNKIRSLFSERFEGIDVEQFFHSIRSE